MLTDKRLFFGVLIFALVIILIGMYNDAEIVINESAQEKFVEVKDTKIVGFKDGKKSWEVSAKYAWAGRDRNKYNIEDIHEGRVFDDKGRIILNKIKGDKANVHTESEDFDAQGNITSYIYLYQKKKRTRRAYIKGEEMHYDADSKMTFFEKNVSIYEKDKILYAEKAMVDHENNTAYLEGKPVFRKKKERFVLRSENMIINWDEDRVIASTNVVLVKGRERKPDPKLDPREIKLRKEKTIIKCDYMDYLDKKGDDMAEFNGNVSVKQPGKEMFGQRGTYIEREDTINIIEKAKMVTEKVSWMLKKSTKKKIAGKETKKMIKKKTTMWADMMTLYIEKKDVHAKQNVRILQNKREAKSDRSVYKDKEEKIYLYDNVRIQDEKKNWVECKKGLVDLRKETFDAIENVKAKFKYEKETEEDYD